MADSTINELASLDSVASNDELVVWDTSASSTKKATLAQVYSPLSLNSVGGAGKYIQSVSQSNGVLSATEITMSAEVSDIDANNFTKGVSTQVIQRLYRYKRVIAPTKRWLRFYGKNSVVIKRGTTFIFAANKLLDIGVDKYVNFGTLTPGTDYFVYIDTSANITCYTSKQTETTTFMYIGRFHTLCADVPSGTTMIAPSAPGVLSVGDKYLIKSYDENEDNDFYTFYNKTISAVTSGTYYDVVTVPHPLAGYSAGDILPESVWCLDFKPNTRYEDAMCYDKDTDLAVDVYLQSGTGLSTRSAYNATHTVSRQQWNHQEDMRSVGKKLLNDNEFTSAAIGSNECTNITGSSDKTTVGGHVDTANRRMISAIGIEEMCGYIWQWCEESFGQTSGSTWANNDGQGNFGQQYLDTRALLAGGAWHYGSACGARCRSAACVRSGVVADIGARGSSRVVTK